MLDRFTRRFVVSEQFERLRFRVRHWHHRLIHIGHVRVRNDPAIDAENAPKLENAGIVARTGEMRWGKRSCEWQPVYMLTELGRALSEAGISPDDYLNGAYKS
jgi:hypothetical protein